MPGERDSGNDVNKEGSLLCFKILRLMSVES